MNHFKSIFVFVLVYSIILAGENSPRKLDRPAAGMIGGVLMVVLGVLSRTAAFAAIDYGTLALLFGMMVLIHFTAISGLLDRTASFLVSLSRTPLQLLWLVCISSGILSALFVNDTICLLMTPLTLAVARRKGLPAAPFLLTLATSSNVGSVMTLTGNPQNMLIGQSSHWTWGAYALRMVPLGLVCLAVNGLIAQLLFSRELKSPPKAELPTQTGEVTPFNRKLAIRTSLVLICLLIGFLAGAPMDICALTAAIALLILANRKPEEAFHSVDWSLLLFFAGLFVVVAGVTKTEGIWITRILPFITTHHSRLGELSLFSLGSAIGSNLFSNVPFVMLLRGWLPNLPNAPMLWLALAASSTLAGNLTLVGSIANLIVARGASKEAPLSFWAFLRIGAITTPITIFASILILWVYSLMGWC